MMEYDVLIIGGGPAGLTAGIYAARGGARTALLTGDAPGGRAAETHLVENYSGVPRVNGWELTDAMRAQAEEAGVEFIYETALSFTPAPALHTLQTAEGNEYAAKAIILAMGTKHRVLGIPNEKELTGRGVSYCATCDGKFFKNKTVMVVGGGATALADTLYLKELAKRVILVHRRQSFRAEAALVTRARQAGNVEFLLGRTVAAIKGNPLSAVVLLDGQGNEEEIAVNGLFVAVGSHPNTAWLDEQLATENGYLVTDTQMRTNLPRVYAAGDVRVTPLRQIITACADGAIAAETALADIAAL